MKTYNFRLRKDKQEAKVIAYAIKKWNCVESCEILKDDNDDYILKVVAKEGEENRKRITSYISMCIHLKSLN